MDPKIEALARLIQTQQYERMIKEGHTPGFAKTSASVKLKEGRKFTKIDVGGCGKYMVENSTGNVFGIHAYGQVHRGHQYGTLDTTDQFDWSGYQARKIK